MTREPKRVWMQAALCLALAVGLLPVGPRGLVASARADEPAVFEVAIQAGLTVTTRDGVMLATDVYLPAREGKPVEQKWPTILMRTPYNKAGGKADGEYFARHGYAFVAQDTRGRYASSGVWHMLLNDGRDGVDTCAWIAEQVWSNGKVGTIGTSYVGGTQHAIALEKAEQLVTAIPVDAMSNLGVQSMRNGGAFELRFWNWIVNNTAPQGSRQSRDPGTAAILKEMKDHRREYLLRLPLRAGTTPLKLASEYESWLVEAMNHGIDDNFWRQNNIVEHADQYQDMPLYLVGGWYDSWAGNTTANYMALTPAMKGPVYLIMGPWVHGGQGGSSHGQVDFGAEAAIADPRAWRRAWYDHWLKGIDNEVGKQAPFATKVRIFVMGQGDGHKTPAGLLYHGGSWRDEHEWPLERAQGVYYYLHARGRLEPATPVADGGATHFRFDPANPVPTIGGNTSSGDGILLSGAWDQRGGEHVWNFPQPVPISTRNDVLVFQSPPLEADTEVTGEIVVKLWAASTGRDTDFTAKLIDVYPPSADFPGGFDLNIGDGIVRGRFRESLKKEVLLKPGEVYPFTIKLYPTSNVFKRGHRIRLDISSSNFPRFDVNPNTGEPLNNHRGLKVVANTIFHDAARPSHILLPVVPPAKAE